MAARTGGTAAGPALAACIAHDQGSSGGWTHRGAAGGQHQTVGRPCQQGRLSVRICVRVSVLPLPLWGSLWSQTPRRACHASTPPYHLGAFTKSIAATPELAPRGHNRRSVPPATGGGAPAATCVAQARTHPPIGLQHKGLVPDGHPPASSSAARRTAPITAALARRRCSISSSSVLRGPQAGAPGGGGGVWGWKGREMRCCKASVGVLDGYACMCEGGRQSARDKLLACAQDGPDGRGGGAVCFAYDWRVGARRGVL